MVGFERQGVPLSALEIHDALLSGATDVDVVEGSYRTGHPDPGSWPQRTVELYYYVRLFQFTYTAGGPDYFYRVELTAVKGDLRLREGAEELRCKLYTKA